MAANVVEACYDLDDSDKEDNMVAFDSNFSFYGILILNDDDDDVFSNNDDLIPIFLSDGVDVYDDVWIYGLTYDVFSFFMFNNLDDFLF